MRDDARGGGVLVLVVLGALAVGVAGATPDGGRSAVDEAAPAGGANASVLDRAAPDPGYEEIRLGIGVRPDASARWTVEYRYDLTDEAVERAFERTAGNLSNPPGVFLDRMRRLAVEPAERATGREMAVGNGSVTAGRTVPSGRTGVVTYRFTWTNFANRTDGRLVVGDAIGGLTVETGTELTVAWPEDLQRASVSPPPDESDPGSVTWDEPFDPRGDSLRVELAGAGGFPVAAVVAAVGAACVALAGGWYARRRWLGTDGDVDGERTDVREPDEELLTDEERVLRLLEREGGRMKQQDLLSEVEWSRTKTSDVVNEMHEAGQIEVYRLGRENVLALPGEIDA